MEGKAECTAVQSSFSLRCWFWRSLIAAVGRRACKEGSQRRGMEVWKSKAVGRTARQGSRAEEVSRRRSVARRLWIVVVFGRRRERDLGMV